MAPLTKAQRAAAPKAGADGSYPIPDRKHAIIALGFAKMHHDPDAASIRAKVHRAYPGLGKKKRAFGSLGG